MDIYNFLKQETIKISLAAIASDEILKILKENLSEREDFIERAELIKIVKPDIINEEINDVIIETKQIVSSFYAISVVKLIKQIKDIFLIDFINKININKIFTGWSVVFPDGSDIAIHKGTYGHEEGYFESYRMPQDEGDVTGDLSVKDVIKRLKINFKENLLIKED